MTHPAPVSVTSTPCRSRRQGLPRWAAPLLACLIGLLGQAHAGPEVKPKSLRVIGGLAGVNQYLRHEEPFWTQKLASLSGGRFTATIVPFDRAGVPGAEMLRLMELGVLPFGTILMSAIAAQYPQYMAVDLPGLNPDMASLRRNVAAFRPYLRKALKEEHGIEMLALYVYPAQMLFCKQPMQRLESVAGRRVRVSSPGQADFVSALGATPVHTSFAQMRHALETDMADCAITGSMSGYSVGLHRLTQYLYPMPVTWGMAIFAANQGAWEALSPDLRALLLREMPKLERSIWDEAERETAEGVACSSGAPQCSLADKGQMTVVAVKPEDERKRRAIFESAVLKSWLRRCTAGCGDIWAGTIGAARNQGPAASKP